MAYETSALGDANGTNVTSDVSNHYGTRSVGGTGGYVKTEGLYSEFAINVDLSPALPIVLPIVTGATVTEIVTANATGAITTLTVGGVDVSAADGAKANYVTLASSNTGAVVLAGPTAGTVVIRYLVATA